MARMQSAADPLTTLRGLHLPTTAGADWTGSATAIAVGLAAAVAFRAAFLIWRRHTRRRRQALAALAATRTLSGPTRVAGQAALLRAIVRQRVGAPASRERGEAWLARLDTALRTKFFGSGAGRAFGDSLYHRDATADPAELDAALVPLLRRLRG